MSSISKKDYEALSDFRYALRQFLRFSEDKARSAGITPQQHQLLLTIKGVRGRDWATVTEVAERLQTRHHTAVGLCMRAEQIGLIKRRVHPEDRRQVCLSVTDHGEKILAQLTQEHRRELERMREDILLPFLKERF